MGPWHGDGPRLSAAPAPPRPAIDFDSDLDSLNVTVHGRSFMDNRSTVKNMLLARSDMDIVPDIMLSFNEDQLTLPDVDPPRSDAATASRTTSPAARPGPCGSPGCLSVPDSPGAPRPGPVPSRRRDSAPALHDDTITVGLGDLDADEDSPNSSSETGTAPADPGTASPLTPPADPPLHRLATPKTLTEPHSLTPPTASPVPPPHLLINDGRPGTTPPKGSARALAAAGAAARTRPPSVFVDPGDEDGDLWMPGQPLSQPSSPHPQSDQATSNMSWQPSTLILTPRGPRPESSGNSVPGTPVDGIVSHNPRSTFHTLLLDRIRKQQSVQGSRCSQTQGSASSQTQGTGSIPTEESGHKQVLWLGSPAQCNDAAQLSYPGLCLVFGLRDGWGGGYEGKKKFMYLKCASHFWLSIQDFILPSRKFFGFGCVGGLAWGGWVR